MRAIAYATSWVLWPALMGLGLLVLFTLDPEFCIPALIIFGFSAFQFLTLVLFEQATPVAREWNLFSDPQKLSHIGHAAVSQAGAAAGVAIAVYLVQIAAARLPMDAAIWPQAWPLAAQIGAALMIYEFGAYWLHRAMHTTPVLWPLHALHHAVERMNVLVTGRIHLFSTLLSKSLLLAPIYFLGASDAVFASVAAISLWSGNLSHANVRMRFPPGFVGVVTTNQTHHLHHDRDMVLGNANYGSTLLIFDRLFGTYVAPDVKPRADVGVADDPVGRNFWLELIAPAIWPYLVLRRRRMSKAAEK